MTLDSIIERLEKATGPNYELEREIQDALEPDRKIHVPHRYTSSVDDALTLAEKVLPGWEDCHGRLIWTHGLKGERIWTADIRYWRSSANHPVAAIALCLAILKAKQMGVGE